MEELFAYEYGSVKTDQQNRTDNRADSSCLDRTDTADLSSAQAGTVQFNSPDDIGDWTSHCAKYGFDIRAANTSGFGEPDRADASPECFECAEIVDRRMDSMKYSVEEKLSKQTEALEKTLDKNLRI